MIEAYQKIVQQAIRKKTENKKFLDKLKKQKPSGLDQLFQEVNDEVFEKIDCLSCANCCTSTGPLFLNKDIDRMAKTQNLRPAIFTEKYLKIDEDGDYVFKAMPCPFLGSDKYCSIYEDRPNACREYPHLHQRNSLQKLGITYQNSLICPAVALALEKLKTHFDFAG
jgi:hypothetical protein